ncbi:RNA polymerase sigma factor [Tenacibaculum aestuarii]|uniref:RNA polymerase sigma factor n=1 Tax=Tenacibaculum aestuarii TaxID=362781 RepID=UPI0038B4B1FA
MRKISDATLILAYQSGDSKALNTLVKKWHLQFCKFAFWMVKDADAAKDIAQESWKVIFNKLTDLKEPEKFKSWAISIVNRKSIDYLRANQRKALQLRNYQQEEVQHNVEEGDDASLYRKKLRKAILELPENQRIIIQLFYLQNYSLKEIGELLGISVGTVKSRLFHAREKLKLSIKNRNHE